MTFFDTLLNPHAWKSAKLDRTAFYSGLQHVCDTGPEPTEAEVADEVCTIATEKLVEPRQLLTGLIKLGLREDFTIVFEAHRVVVEDGGRRKGGSSRGNTPPLKVVHKRKKPGQSAASTEALLPLPWQPKARWSSLLSPAVRVTTVSRRMAYSPKNSAAFIPSVGVPTTYIHGVCRCQIAGACKGRERCPSTVHELH